MRVTSECFVLSNRINVCFWETAHPPLPKPSINAYFLHWAKCKVWGVVARWVVSQKHTLIRLIIRPR